MKKRRILKVLTMVCLAVLLVQWLPMPVAAARSITEVQDEIAEKKKHIEDLAQAIEDNKGNIQAAEAALAEYEKQYNELVALIDEQEVLIGNATDDLEAKTQELSDTIVSIQDNKDKYATRLKAIYEMNSSNAMMVSIFSAESFTELMQVADALQRIGERDTQLLQDLADEKAQYEAQKADLEVTIADLQARYQQLQDDRDWCSAEMARMKQIIADNNYQIQLSEQETEDTEAEVKKLQAELNAILAALNSKGSQQGDGSIRYDGPLLWPVPGYGRVSSYYGDPRSNTRGHYGIDIPAPTGTPIVASADGYVLTATWHYSYGYYVVLDHGQSLRTLYAHNSQLLVQPGQYVLAGETIALCGNTGNSYGAHLHIEVHEGGQRHNPLSSGYLNA